ncbi:MAG: hypothetical protein M3Z23_08395 [Acidobacteriota bacterium]|nr:hypothetical protein [Acidobacteriota bacterium]
MVGQALTAYQAVKSGITRKDVEKNFKSDGGIHFRDHGQLEVTFALAQGRTDAMSSPDDVVATVSKLFIDYPTKD